MSKIDFYIVGAPKCGTTAFHQYLSEHPGISMLPKELHYYGSDLHYNQERLTKEVYESEVNKLSNSNTLKGEVAVYYLASEKAAEEIKQASPNAKIIILLRNPAELMYSMHSQMTYQGNEPEKDFEKALELGSDRFSKKNLPNHYYCPHVGICYKELVSFSKQIERYTNSFPKENILFLSFHEFIKNPPAVYNKLLDFLEVAHHTPNFEIVNANTKTKNEKLRDITLTPSKALKAITKTILPSKKLREATKELIWKANTAEEKREDMDDSLRKELKQEWEKEIDILKEITGLDLH